ncbi:MAG: hypothetical protein K8R74_18125, partial [Bacteroidales bacterium]|nr:hypothetical protein [Bacteroidales bacterium]
MRKLFKLSSLFVILYLVGCAFGNYLNAQGKWKYFNKDSLGVKIEPIKGTGVSSQKNIFKWSIRSSEVIEFKNLEFFTKYDLIDQLFIEDKNRNVFYFHNNKFYSLSEDILNIDSSLNADIIHEFLEKTITIDVESTFEKPGAPEYEGLKKVFIDSKRNFWVIHKNGLYRYFNDNWKLYNDSLGIPVDRINNIFENTIKDSSIWVTAKKDSYEITCELYQYLEGENGEDKWLLHNKKTGYEGGDCGFPQFDSKGNVWVALYSWTARINGFAKYDGIKWTYIRKEDGLIGTPFVFKFDKNDGLWYVTINGTNKTKGIVYYYNEEWKYYKKKVLGSDIRIGNIDEDERGNIWFSGMNGIAFYDGNEFLKYNTKIDTRRNGTLNFFEDSQSNLWIISQTGLARLKNNSFIDFTEILDLSLKEIPGRFNYNTILDNYIKMFEDSHGFIWLIKFALLENHTDQFAYSTNMVSYEGCIYRCKNGTWEKFDLPDKTG